MTWFIYLNFIVTQHVLLRLHPSEGGRDHGRHFRTKRFVSTSCNLLQDTINSPSTPTQPAAPTLSSTPTKANVRPLSQPLFVLRPESCYWLENGLKAGDDQIFKNSERTHQQAQELLWGLPSQSYVYNCWSTALSQEVQRTWNPVRRDKGEQRKRIYS